MINSELFIHQIASGFSAEILEDDLATKTKAAEAKKLADDYDKKKDYKNALRLYKTASFYGDSDATYMVGVYYENGYTSMRNLSLSYVWYQKGANQGNLKCLKRMALDYYTGNEYCPQDTATAKEYWICVYVKSPDSINEIELNKYFPSWKKEYNKGFNSFAFKTQKQLTNIAEKGIVAAFYWLGVNLHGESLSNELKVLLGYKTDVDKARRWLLKAALEDYQPAALYLKKHYGVDVEEATSGEEMYLLGCNYSNGSSEQDKDLRYFWLRKAVNSGYEKACNNLGVCYDCAIGTEKNQRMANDLFSRAMNVDGDGTAYFNYGLSYFYGKEVIKNESTAKRLFLKARARGSEYARDFLKEQYGIDKDIGLEFSDSTEKIIFNNDDVIIYYCGLKTSENGFQIKFSCENNTENQYNVWLKNIIINGTKTNNYRLLGEFSPKTWIKQQEEVQFDQVLSTEDVIEFSVEIDDEDNAFLCETNTMKITIDKFELKPLFTIIGIVDFSSLRLKDDDAFDDEENIDAYNIFYDPIPVQYLQGIDYTHNYQLVIDPESLADAIRNKYNPRYARRMSRIEEENYSEPYDILSDISFSMHATISQALKYV